MVLARRTLCALASLGAAVALQSPATTTQRCATTLHAVSDRRALLEGLALASATIAAPAFARAGSLQSTKKGSYGYDEPETAEFKEAEKQRAAYREKAKGFRGKWDPDFAKFQDAKTDADRITALKRLEYLILSNEGLPSGLRLTDFITLCRRVKAKAVQTGGWKTDTEIAYMDMIRSIKKAENPNYNEENFL
jgi:hypothetical protein